MSSVTEIIPSIKLYPVYIDKIKTCAEGRRVALDIAIEDPEAFSMAMSLQKLGFEMTMDIYKNHPRDFFKSGRVEVILKKNNNFVNPQVTNKTALLKLLCENYEHVPLPEELDPEKEMKDMLKKGFSAPASAQENPQGLTKKELKKLEKKNKK